MPPSSQPYTRARPGGRVGKKIIGSRLRRQKQRLEEAAVPELIAKKAIPKLRHKSYIEIVDNEDKKDKKLELIKTYKTEPDPGYEFLPYGDPELTNLCKELSREKGAVIFVVLDKRYRKELVEQTNRKGYYIRQSIIEEAKAQLGISGPLSYVDELPQTQEEINAQADAALRDLFPRIPNTDRQEIINHSFRLGATNRNGPMVGINPNIPLSRRVQLAVVAHIRHTHTRYDELLKEADWRTSRKAVEQACLETVIRWRGDEENGRDDLDEILREVIIISDNEDSDDVAEEEGDEGIEPSDDDSDSDYEPIPARNPRSSISRRTAQPKTPVSAAKARDIVRPSTPPHIGTRDDPFLVISPPDARVPVGQIKHGALPSYARRYVQCRRPYTQSEGYKQRHARYMAARAQIFPNSTRVEVVNRVPPPPQTAVPSATAPYDPRDPIVMSRPVAQPIYRETRIQRLENRDDRRSAGLTTSTTIQGMRRAAMSPVEIVQPQPQRPATKILQPQTEMIDPSSLSPVLALARTIRPQMDGMPIEELVVPSVEFNASQREYAPGFVRPVVRIPGTNNNGKRTRDNSHDESPHHRHPSSPAPVVDTTDTSPYKRTRIEYSSYGGPSGYSVRDAPPRTRPLSQSPSDPIHRYEGPVRPAPPTGLVQERQAYSGGYAIHNDGYHHLAVPRGPRYAYEVPPQVYRPHPALASGPVYSSMPSTTSQHQPSQYADSSELRPPHPGEHDNGAWTDPHQAEPSSQHEMDRIFNAIPPGPSGGRRFGPPPVGGWARPPVHRSFEDGGQIIMTRQRAAAGPLPPSSNNTFWVRPAVAGDRYERREYDRGYEPGFPLPADRYVASGPIPPHRSLLHNLSSSNPNSSGRRVPSTSATNPIVLDD